MRKHVPIISVTMLIMLAIACPIFVTTIVKAQQGDVQRKVLVQQDLPIAGYQAVQVLAIVGPGAREGKHTHPGTLVGYVLEGTLTLEREGKPTASYNAGDSFVIEAGTVHEGINNGKVPYKAITTFVVEKGKPLTTQVKQ